MAEESVVMLMGPGAGPNIPTYGKKSFARVSGMNGGLLTLETKDEKRESLGNRVVKSDGDFELISPSAYASASCEDADVTLIVQLVRE